MAPLPDVLGKLTPFREEGTDTSEARQRRPWDRRGVVLHSSSTVVDARTVPREVPQRTEGAPAPQAERTWGANVPRMETPRIRPLAEDEWGGDTAVLLQSLRRGDRPVLNIFATLARHPDLFTDWLGFGARLLGAGALPPRHRELAILRTSWNTGAEYEWGHHARIAVRAGVAEEEVARVAERGLDGWAPMEAAVLQAADELYRDSRISDKTWAVLAEAYDERQLIELCMLVGQYHVVAFTLNSLGVQREFGVDGFPQADRPS